MSAPPQIVSRIATFRLAQLLYDYANKVNENIAAVYKEQQLKRMKDVFHLSSHRKVMHTDIPWKHSSVADPLGNIFWCTRDFFPAPLKLR